MNSSCANCGTINSTDWEHCLTCGSEQSSDIDVFAVDNHSESWRMNSTSAKISGLCSSMNLRTNTIARSSYFVPMVALLGYVMFVASMFIVRVAGVDEPIYQLSNSGSIFETRAASLREEAEAASGSIPGLRWYVEQYTNNAESLGESAADYAERAQNAAGWGDFWDNAGDVAREVSGAYGHPGWGIAADIAGEIGADHQRQRAGELESSAQEYAEAARRHAATADEYQAKIVEAENLERDALAKAELSESLSNSIRSGALDSYRIIIVIGTAVAAIALVSTMIRRRVMSIVGQLLSVASLAMLLIVFVDPGLGLTRQVLPRVLDPGAPQIALLFAMAGSGLVLLLAANVANYLASREPQSIPDPLA